MSFSDYIRRKEEKLQNGAKYLRVGKPRRIFASLAKISQALRNGDFSHEISQPHEIRKACEFEMRI